MRVNISKTVTNTAMLLLLLWRLLLFAVVYQGIYSRNRNSSVRLLPPETFRRFVRSLSLLTQLFLQLQMPIAAELLSELCTLYPVIRTLSIVS